MKFKYETHLHTAPASACAREPGPEYARMNKELCNTGNQPEADALAFRYAANLGLFMSAGSDIHSAGGDKALAAIAFDSRLNGVEDFVKAVKENAGHELVLPEGRCEWTEGTAPAAPVCLRGRNDVPTGGLKELLRPV